MAMTASNSERASGNRNVLRLSIQNEEGIEEKVRIDSIIDAEAAAKERRRAQNRLAQRKHRRRMAEKKLSAMSKSPDIRVPSHPGPCCSCVTGRPGDIATEDYSQNFISITSPNSSYGPLTPSAFSDYESHSNVSAREVIGNELPNQWSPFWSATSPLFDTDANVLPPGDALDGRSHSPIPSSASLDIQPFQDSQSSVPALPYDVSPGLLRRQKSNSLSPEGPIGGQFPLHLAARGGYIGTISLLISRGARLDIKDTYGRTALHYAAEAGQFEAVTMLLSLGANPFLIDGEGCNSLHVAASKGQEDIVRVLMERGMDPNLGVASDIEAS
ncbi:hypothetical protein GGI43DRAFT_132040 [Trichoderma evansii]